MALLSKCLLQESPEKKLQKYRTWTSSKIASSPECITRLNLSKDGQGRNSRIGLGVSVFWRTCKLAADHSSVSLWLVLIKVFPKGWLLLLFARFSLHSLNRDGFGLTWPHARQWCLLLVSALKGSLHFMHMVTSLSRIHLGALFPSSAFWVEEGESKRSIVKHCKYFTFKNRYDYSKIIKCLLWKQKWQPPSTEVDTNKGSCCKSKLVRDGSDGKVFWPQLQMAWKLTKHTRFLDGFVFCTPKLGGGLLTQLRCFPWKATDLLFPELTPPPPQSELVGSPVQLMTYMCSKEPNLQKLRWAGHHILSQ